MKLVKAFLRAWFVMVVAGMVLGVVGGLISSLADQVGWSFAIAVAITVILAIAGLFCMAEGTSDGDW